MIKIEKLLRSYKVKTETDKHLGSFQLDSDGSYYFYITEELEGCWTSQSLREIAEKLDEVNKPFDDEVNKYFAKK